MVFCIKVSIALADAVCVCFSLVAAFWLKLDGFSAESFYSFARMLWLFVPSAWLCFYIMGLYNRSARYSSIDDLIAVFISVVLLSLCKLVEVVVVQNAAFSGSVLTIDFMLSLIFIGALHMLPRIALHYYKDTKLAYLRLNKQSQRIKRVLVMGAGQAGEAVAREVKHNLNLRMDIVGFIDDNPHKHKKIIQGIEVLGGTTDLEKITSKYAVDEIIIAIPSATKDQLRHIVVLAQKTKLPYKMLPGMQDLIEGKLVSMQLRDIRIEDLLHRVPIKIDANELAEYINGKTVLITGAGGSIGSELCRQLLRFKPSSLILLGHGENSIFTIHQELLKNESLGDAVLIPIIADIQDKNKIDQVFRGHKPDIVFHAAAHKHVPLMEFNPAEAVKNNIVGTYNVVEAACKYKTERFVMISTDKAVRPTSVMGASKQIAEKIMRCCAKRSSTRYSAVRFGNVLGSRGSVIPIFKKQIEDKGPVCVTHPEMVRYFMTIPEASQLVLQASLYGTGGEVFILDMGDPVKIVDLAKDLIRLAGYEPEKDIQIKYTGIRPGEKLYEELLTATENKTVTKNSRIFVAKPEEVDEEKFNALLKELIKASNDGKVGKILELMQKIVPAYKPTTLR